MNHLHQKIASRVDRWRNDGYPSAEFPAIAEILDWSRETETGNLRFLRRPQLRALETYWYLRLIENTPHVFDLYRKFYPKQYELLTAFGLDHTDIKAYVLDEGIDALWQRIRTDDAFVKDFKLEFLRETLTLDYPSYILALAMALRKWETPNPERLKYQMIFTGTDTVSADQVQEVRRLMTAEEK